MWSCKSVAIENQGEKFCRLIGYPEQSYPKITSELFQRRSEHSSYLEHQGTKANSVCAPRRVMTARCRDFTGAGGAFASTRLSQLFTNYRSKTPLKIESVAGQVAIFFPYRFPFILIKKGLKKVSNCLFLHSGAKNKTKQEEKKFTVAHSVFPYSLCISTAVGVSSPRRPGTVGHLCSCGSGSPVSR